MPNLNIEIDGDDVARMLMDADTSDVETFAADFASTIARNDFDPFFSSLFENLNDEEIARLTSLLQAEKDRRAEFADDDVRDDGVDEGLARLKAASGSGE